MNVEAMNEGDPIGTSKTLRPEEGMWKKVGIMKSSNKLVVDQTIRLKSCNESPIAWSLEVNL
jgi:hypothetical protein